MGAFASHQNAGVEEVDISVNHAYRYPPKAGNYFSSHFIMGGERFDTAQPEMYLFGENSDLNFLGSKPAPFPYPAPSASEPIRTLKALINIRKESLRFVRVPDESLSLKEPDNRGQSTHFNIEFTFDCDVRCAITVMYFCTEEVTNGGLIYTPRDPSMNSQTYHYKMGANQQFSQVCHVFDPSQYPEESLLHTFDRELMPIVIYCVAEEGEEPFQSHVTIAIVEKHSDGYALKPLKQKLFVDGLCYLLQEIYGIENKTTDNAKVTSDEDPDDNGAECVICMCDLRDTLILPCRHLCLCNCCADSLRYQANNCPICRAPFRALLQIKALQKSAALVGGVPPPTSNPENGDNIPAGYEAVSLIEALNGPSVAPQQPTAPPFQNMYVQLPQNAIDSALDIPHEEEDNARGYDENVHQDKLVSNSALEDSTTQTERPLSSTSSSEVLSTSRDAGVQMRLSVLMAQESEEDCLNSAMDSVPPPSSPSTFASSRKKRIAKFFKEDSVECISETGRETIEGVVLSRKHRKSSTPTSPEHSSVIKETSLCNNESDDIEDLTETLSLLDDLQLHGNKSERVSASNSDFKQAPSMSPTGLKETTSDIKNKKLDVIDDHAIVNQNDQAELQNGATGYDAEGSYDDRENAGDRLSLKTGRGSSKKAKQKRKSSRKSLGSSSTYTPAQYVESVGNEGSNVPITQDSQSLPGTPLSTSSAVSRSSEASMSSASSTRALITSRPSQPFSTNP